MSSLCSDVVRGGVQVWGATREALVGGDGHEFIQDVATALWIPVHNTSTT